MGASAQSPLSMVCSGLDFVDGRAGTGTGAVDGRTGTGAVDWDWGSDDGPLTMGTCTRPR